MVCDIRKLNQTKPAGYISGISPSCIAAPFGFFIGNDTMKELTQARLHEILSYNKETGDFIWKSASKYHNQLNGKLAGTIRISRGKHYRWIKIDNRAYSAHRLAWFYCCGKWPNIIDHKHGNTLDNRITNLNNVNILMNNQNHKTKIKSNGLPTGVRNSASGRFQARIKANGKTIYIGAYDTIQEAKDAYGSARKKLHYCPIEELK